MLISVRYCVDIGDVLCCRWQLLSRKELPGASRCDGTGRVWDPQPGTEGTGAAQPAYQGGWEGGRGGGGLLGALPLHSDGCPLSLRKQWGGLEGGSKVRLASVWTLRPLGYERVYLPLYKVADTPFHIQGTTWYCESRQLLSALTLTLKSNKCNIQLSFKSFLRKSNEGWTRRPKYGILPPNLNDSNKQWW